MSPRDLFWFLAGVLVAVAIMVTVRAWLRERPALDATSVDAANKRAAIPAFAVPLAAALALVGVALGIYFLLGSPDSIASANAAVAAQPPRDMQQASHDTQMNQQQSPTAGSLDDVTNKLAARLAAQGGSDNDWKLLAESYEYMGRTAEANAARAHVASAAIPGATGTVGAMGDSTAGQPTTGGLPTGEQIADIANALDTPHARPTADAGATPPAPATNSNRPGANGPQGAKATAGAGTSQTPSAAKSALGRDTGTTGNAEISGTVNITSQLASQTKAGATLFIYAKQPNAPGPPLAVLRVRAEHWPVSFTLNDGNAMVPGRNLSNANTVQIEARISKNGDALPQSGDLVGSVTSVNPRDGHPVKISIDREIG